MYDPYVAATTWLYETLALAPIDGVSGVYEDNAPQDVTDKDSVWVTFELLAPPSDVDEVAKQIIWTECVFAVQAVARGRSTKALGDIAATIHERLHRQDGTVTDAVVISSTRQRPHHDSWTSVGIEYRSLGGIYNLIVQPA